MVKIPLLCDGEIAKWQGGNAYNSPFPLFGRRAQQIFRIFLTRISNIVFPQNWLSVVSWSLACKRVDQTFYRFG